METGERRAGLAGPPRGSPRVVVAITGGPGAGYGVRLLEALARAGAESHLVMCRCAQEGIEEQTGLRPEQVAALATRTYQPGNQAARISSGSFLTAGMVVAPCSLRSLQAIGAGLASNLVHRAADVTMKEQRPLLLLLPEGPRSGPERDGVARLSRVPGVRVLEPLPAIAWDGDSAERTARWLLDLLGLPTTSRNGPPGAGPG